MDRENWGRALYIKINFVNGQSMTKRISHDDLAADCGEDIYAIRQVVSELREVFENFKDMTHLKVVDGGKTFYVNPANVLYIETTGFDSWGV